MAIKSVGFRLETDGKAQVKNDFAEVQTAAVNAMDAFASSAEEAAARATKATNDYTQRQLDAFAKQAQAAKLAAAQANTRSGFDDALAQPGNGSQFATVNVDRSSGAAKASASVFQDAFGEQDQRAAAAAQATAAAEALAARAEDERTASLVKLRAAIDPLSVAQAQYGANVAAADSLLAHGSISTNEHAAALDLYSRRLESARQGLDDNAKADAAAEAAAQRLRAQIDPLGAAQARYDDELKSHADLLARGKISETEHAAAVTLSGKALEDAKRELGEHSSALSFNRAQMIIAQSAVMRFSDSIIAGQSPIRAFALEAHKLGEVISFDDGGVAGGMSKLTALITPTSVAIAGIAIVTAVATAAAIGYGDSLAKLNAVAGGAGAVLGLSGAQLEENAEAAARAGNTTVGAARDIEAGYLQIAKSGTILSGLTSVTKDYAAATGQDLAGAQKELAAAFSDPIQGAQDLAEKYGLLTQAQADHIADLVQEGQQERAQKELLDDIAHAFGGAAEQAEGLAASWDHIKSAADRAWTSAGRFFNTYGGAVVNGVADAFLLELPGSGAGEQKSAAGVSNAAANQARARAANLTATYQGDNRDALQRTIGTLQAGIKAGGTPDQLNDWTSALGANQHALDSWVPSAQKANDVAAAQAKLSAARGPQAKAAAAEALVLAQNEGAVITRSDLMAQAHSRAAAASAAASRSGDKHAQTLAREAASMEVAAKQSLILADAYLQGSAQGVEAEARRKAATDATKKGIDVEAEARRQLNLQVAEAVATGAKSVAGMRDETAGRQAVLDQVASGTLSVDDMSRALSDEAALRPLITLRTIAQGSALDALNKVITQYRVALTDAHKAEDQMGFEKAMQDSIDKTEEFKASIVDLAHTPLDRALNTAQRSASLQADSLHLALSSPSRNAFVGQKVNEAQEQYEANRAKYVHDTLDGQQDSLALSQRELELAGANDNYRTLELDKLKLAQTIRRQFPDMAAADVAKLMAGVEAQDAMNARLKVASAAWSEIRGVGEQFADDVLNPDNWSSWGNIAKTVLKDIESEFIKLVALNPLKNLINGNNALPTLSSITSLFGLSGKIDSLATSANNFNSNFSIAADPLSIGHNATGTESWSGGMTWVNENGPEIADLPNGTRIYPAAETRRMVANDNGGVANAHVSVGLNDELLTAKVSRIVDGRVGMIAPALANGAATLANVRYDEKRRRRMR